MTTPLKYLRFCLLPFALIYGTVLWIRNFLFNIGIFKSKEYKKAVIVIGNLAVGGSGKTPMAEYIIGLLYKKYPTMLLSRGYKRKTKGFVMATDKHTTKEIGDEPFQVKHKFKGLTVVVDEDRVHGIDLALQKNPDLKAIVLDDAFQHRYVKPGKGILLTDYNNLFTNDYLMPVGRLREYQAAKKRAHLIVVTKCPSDLPVDEKYQIAKKIAPLPHQEIYFAALKYGLPFAYLENTSTFEWKQKQSVLVVCGIANPKPLVQYINSKVQNYESLIFPDHHDYQLKDFSRIDKAFSKLEDENKAIVITEKDAVKWRHMNIPETVKKATWVLPVHFHILFKETEKFNQEIYSYVESNL